MKYQMMRQLEVTPHIIHILLDSDGHDLIELDYEGSDRIGWIITLGRHDWPYLGPSCHHYANISNVVSAVVKTI